MNKKEKGEVAAPTLFGANHEDYVQVLNDTKVAENSETQKFSAENVEVLEKFEAVKTTATMPRITRDEQPTEEAFQSGFLSKQETPKMFPIHTLRLEIQSYIREVASVYHVPLDMATTCVYSAAMTAVGRKLKLEEGAHTNDSSLWLIQLGASGKGKSPVQKEVMKPLKEYDRVLRAEYEAELDKWEADGKKGRKPIKHRKLVQIATAESVQVAMGNNPNGITLFRPELSGWFKSYDQYSKGGEMDVYLQYASGEDVDVERVTRDGHAADDPFFGVLGGIQPDRLHLIFTEEMFASGLAARCLFVYPHMSVCKVYESRGVSLAHKKFWGDLMQKLFDIDVDNSLSLLSPSEIKAYREAKKEGIVLTLSPEAKREYKKYYEDTQEKIEQADRVKDYRTTAMLAKLEIFALKWALVSYLLGEDAYQSNYTFVGLGEFLQIDAETMRSAIDAMSLFEQYAHKAYDTQQDATFISPAQAIRVLARHYGNDFNQSKIAEGLGLTQGRISQIIKEK